jgi:hypothetical protein
MSLSGPIPEGEDPAGSYTPAAEGTGLTLLRLGLWTEEMKMKMRMMALVVDDARCESFLRPGSSIDQK